MLENGREGGGTGTTVRLSAIVQQKIAEGVFGIATVTGASAAEPVAAQHARRELTGAAGARNYFAAK